MIKFTDKKNFSLEVTLKIALIPLWLAYFVFPLSSLLSVYFDLQFRRNWIDLFWILLAVFYTFKIITYNDLMRCKVINFGFFLLVFIGMTGLLVGVSLDEVPAIAAALEIKPFLYVIVVILVARNGRIPQPQHFCRAGVALSMLLIAETAIRSVLSGSLQRALGSGEVNYDAALILLSLVFALASSDLTRRYSLVLFVGLLASFSRTSLVAACLLLIISRTVPVPIKGLAICAAITAIVLSFLMRGLELGNLEGMDRYWMWTVGIDHLVSQGPWMAINLTPGSSIEVDVPPFILDLWLEQQYKLDLNGIYPYHFHALWLRLVLGWGWVPLAILLVPLIHMIFVSHNMPPESRGFACTCLVLGLTMGLFYLSNVGVPYLLAWAQLRGKMIVLRRQPR